jgi:hypothetical protein
LLDDAASIGRLAILGGTHRRREACEQRLVIDFLKDHPHVLEIDR